MLNVTFKQFLFLIITIFFLFGDFLKLKKKLVRWISFLKKTFFN